MVELQLIGGGRMGEALLAGLLAAEWAPAGQIRVVERLSSRRRELATRFPGVDVGPDVGAAPGAVIAVKPADVPEAVSGACRAGVERILSIAAGVTLGRLQSAAGAGVAIVRAMPNTPALIGAGVAAVAAGSAATEADLEWAEGILRSVGEVVAVPEHLLDAVTGLSGSGPAYVFLVAEALAEAGVLAGLPRDISEKLTHQTLLGSARLLMETDQGAEELRQAVTSPAGTTAAGLRVLEQAGIRAAFIDAVIAARDRSSELGDS
ncbi:MAG: Pyrroline-5-carboxylate reductase [Acidimicrobiales bacterium]|nr:MAG: pyrroline-5-carboxylate reductase [Actinomycetota bacterium]MBV6507512.1 Pyrroline-5-carboxylate reductase [Acidimicrobiales bacterium]RIK07887.1 MAG: pyrroline-5-carboxylate reductase [Acidobacteriota bacterium]